MEKEDSICVLSIDVGIRNMACCKADVVSGAVTRIRDWRVIDLCPSTTTQFCAKCASTGKKRAIKAALQHPTRDGVHACLAHARQEQFGFFPPPTNPAKERRRNEKRKLGENVDDDEVVDPECNRSAVVDAAIDARLAVSKSALRLMTLMELRTFMQRHPGFADMGEATFHTKSSAVDAMAAHMSARTWRRTTTTPSSSSSAATISVVTAGMRFATIAQSTALFAEVDELVVENQLGFVAARMKSMQDVISCMAVFAGVPVVRAVSAATKLRNLEPIVGTKNGDDAKEDEQEAGREYRSRKTQGIAQCRAWMKSNPVASEAWMDEFEKTKKKDDMADALLQLLGQFSSPKS